MVCAIRKALDRSVPAHLLRQPFAPLQFFRGSTYGYFLERSRPALGHAEGS
jgi:hypothetical protein